MAKRNCDVVYILLLNVLTRKSYRCLIGSIVELHVDYETGVVSIHGAVSSYFYKQVLLEALRVAGNGLLLTPNANGIEVTPDSHEKRKSTVQPILPVQTDEEHDRSLVQDLARV
jgi:hypothetical protein